MIWGVSLLKNAPEGNHPLGGRPNPVTGCPLTAAMAAIGGKWKLIIVYWLAKSPKHFSALRQVIPGISPKVLTEQLRELVQDDIVVRNPTGAAPAPVQYSLTLYGRALLPLVEEIRRWGSTHLTRVGPDQVDVSQLEIKPMPPVAQEVAVNSRLKRGLGTDLDDHRRCDLGQRNRSALAGPSGHCQARSTTDDPRQKA
jgi:DNA-binding HxlR family transcriptional regulator